MASSVVKHFFLPIAGAQTFSLPHKMAPNKPTQRCTPHGRANAWNEKYKHPKCLKHQVSEALRLPHVWPHDVTGPIRSLERARNNTSEGSHLPWIMPMDCHKDPGKKNNMIAHVSLSESARPTTQINISRPFNIFKGIQTWHLLWHPLPKRPYGFHCGQLQKVAVTKQIFEQETSKCRLHGGYSSPRIRMYTLVQECQATRSRGKTWDAVEINVDYFSKVERMHQTHQTM